MDGTHNNYSIKKGELLLLFVLFIIGGGLIFAVGVRIGKNILQNDCQAILEENQKRIEELEAVKPKVAEAVDEKTTEALPEPVTKNPSDLGIKEITVDIKGKYTIQISSYQDEEEAQKEADSLYKEGYKLAYYMEAEVPGKGLWYRVGIGFFEKKDSAQMFADMLKKQGKITSFLIRRVD